MQLISDDKGGGSSFTLVRQISQACTIFNFQLSILIYSCDLLMIIGPAAVWYAWPVPCDESHWETKLNGCPRITGPTHIYLKQQNFP